MQCACTSTISTCNFVCQLSKTKKARRDISMKDKGVEQMYPERPQRSDPVGPPRDTP